MHFYKFLRAKKADLMISIIFCDVCFFISVWESRWKSGCFCLHVCTCECLCSVLCSVQVVVRNVCTCLAGMAESSPASTWQWNAGNRRCRTTNGCRPKWRSMKRKKKPAPLWSSYTRYCRFKSCTGARVRSTRMLPLFAEEQRSLALTCCMDCELSAISGKRHKCWLDMNKNSWAHAYCTCALLHPRKLPGSQVVPFQKRHCCTSTGT